MNGYFWTLLEEEDTQAKVRHNYRSSNSLQDTNNSTRTLSTA